MPKVGDEEFAYTPEGIAAAKAKSLETGIPTANAPDRMETYQLGGQIQPPTAPSMTPTPKYDKGGKVKTRKSAQLESAKARYESAKKGKYYDVESGKVKKHGRTKEGYKDPKWLKNEETTYNLVKSAKEKGKKK